MLSGEIPSTLGSCTSLEELLMEGNIFQGQVPSSLGLLKGLQKLDLSRNNLSGEIPKALEDLRSLEILNLSYNHFEGAIPMKGVFRNASATLIQGNDNLCGGILEFHLPRCTFNEPKKRSRLRMKIIISVICVLSSATIVLACLFLNRSKKKRSEEFAANSVGNAQLMVSYQSLRNATNGFSSANLIGTGSFGSVYKGILDKEEGKIIAVKVLNLMHHGAFKSFVAECEALKNIRHRNLVKLITACSSTDYQGNDFKALIYEFMVNRSLEEWLHPTFELDEATKSLDLLQRLNIAIDVASALQYLHHHCEKTIVHCDLKPSNILLDDEMIGHVSDFGLAKILFQDTFYSSTNQSSSVGVRGTIGYTPPEYGVGSKVSTYGDTYSYGILLLEMFTGKRPTDDMFGENMNLHNFVKTNLPKQVVQLIDPILFQEIFNSSKIKNHTRNIEGIKNNGILECLISIFEIGIACCIDLPQDRMNIGNVVAQLSSIRKKHFGM
nr:LRR-RLK [Vernicia fordii]